MNIWSFGRLFKVAGSIYRDRFVEYYRLALIACGWILVPVYGWAKYAATMGLLSRLTYGELTGNSETIREARRLIKPKTWLFFGAGIRESIILYAKGVLLVLISLPLIRNSPFPFLSQSYWIWWYAIALASSYIWYRMRSRLFLYEISLAVEDDVSVSESVNTGWHLVTGAILPIQITLWLLSFVSTLPLTLGSIFDLSHVDSSGLLTFGGVVFIPFLPFLILITGGVAISAVLGTTDNTITTALSIMILLLINLVYGALLIPLCQSIKAVIYQNLRTRE
ncbi:MAG: hypothetical protein AAFY50_08695 [Cyanobacteria bacterium J06648_1]